MSDSIKLQRNPSLHQIENASVHPGADVESTGFTSDSTLLICDEEITVRELPEHLSQSVEIFSRHIRSLNAEKMIHKYRKEISYAIEKLVSKARGKADVKKLYEIVQSNAEIESASRLIIAKSLLDWGDLDRAKRLCKNVFYDDNKYDIWNPSVESIEILARLDRRYTTEVLLSFVEQRIQEHVWMGYGAFLLYVKALDRLGDEYLDIIHKLYLSFSRFIEYQFEGLDSDVPSSSPYQW